MSRINTNVSSLIAQRVVNTQNQSLSTSLERLSTGLRINRGKDDPAGLIASENLRKDMTAIGAAVSNAERAEQMVNVAEGGLQEVSTLLTELQGHITTVANSAGLSQEEKEAAQLQVDSILQSIDRIAGSTSFEGMKLLNGNFDYNVSGVNQYVTDYKINGAKLEHGGSQAVEVVVTQSAQHGQLLLSMGAAALDLSAANTFTIEVAGELGARELSFSSSTSVANVITAINTYKDVTGVSASIVGTKGINLASSEFGDDAFASVKVVEHGNMDANGTAGIYLYEAGDAGTASTTLFSEFSAATNTVQDYGQDVGASINGITATADGLKIQVSSDFLDVEMHLDGTTAGQGAVDVGSISAFTITGGGADFQLAGNVDIGGKVSLGMIDASSRKLGRSTIGFLDSIKSGDSNNLVDGDLSDAQKIVSQSIKDVSSLRGRIGAFQKNTVGATMRSLNVALENTTAAESVIRDTDFATETAKLTRSQILVNASMNVLSIANSQPQNVLSLLG
jgi:flagellin